MTRSPSRCLLTLVLVSLTSCTGTESPTETNDTPTPVATTATLSAATVSLASLGATEQLTATVLDQNGATMSGAAVTWMSSATPVASVSPTGLVTAVDNGTATITATSGAATVTASVTVAQVAASVALTPGFLILPGSGSSTTVSASVLDALGAEIAGATLTWASDDEAIATVDATGLVTAIAAGTVDLMVEATAGGQSVTQPLSVVVNGTVQITTTTLPNGAKNLDYGTVTLNATGGGGSYMWTLASGTLPTGLSLATNGDVTGTPTVVETSAFTVEVTSGDGQMAQRALSVTVTAATPPTITTTSPMPPGAVSVSYHQTLTATGGDGSYAWMLAHGTTLAAGLALNTATGVISGTPSATGTTNFDVEVTTIGLAATKTLQITITNAPLVVTTTSLPGGTQGAAYSQTLSATGGDASYSWSVTAESLPAGLNLNPSTGQISGTPSVVGTRSFTAQVTSGDGQAATQMLSITISGPPLVITTTSPPDGLVGVAYSHTLAATGGDGNYTWSMGFASLPAGLSLNSTTGEISGTPTTTERLFFSVNVMSDGEFASQGFFITVRGDLQPGDVVFGDGSAFADLTQGAIFKKDLTTGSLYPIAAAGLTEGVFDVGYDRNRDLIFGVADPFSSGVRVIEVEPVTGAQRLVSQGGFLQNGVSGMTVGLDGQLYVTSVETSAFGIQERLFRIDPVTGTQESLAQPNGPTDIVTAADGLIYIAARGIEVRDGTNFLVGAILEYDPASGLTREVSLGGLLNTSIRTIAIDRDGSLLAAIGASIFRVDMGTGSQTLLGTPIPSHQTITGMAVQQDGTILVLNGNAQWIVRVDRATFAAEVIPSGFPRLVNPRSLIIIP